MTREEAFRLAMRACEETWNDKTCKQIKEALEQEHCEDAISRQAVHDFLTKWLSDYLTDDEREALETVDAYIDELPPVISKQSIESEFIRWVAEEIFDEDLEYNKDAFAEIACRKLEKMGIVKADGDAWSLVEREESDG